MILKIPTIKKMTPESSVLQIHPPPNHPNLSSSSLQAHTLPASEYIHSYEEEEEATGEGRETD